MPGSYDERYNFDTPAGIVRGLKSNDLGTKIRAASAIRLIQGRAPNSTPLVDAGVIPPLVEALGYNDCTELQHKAALCITDISYGNPVAVVNGGAIPMLSRLLARGPELGENAAWALGRLADGGPITRDAVLNEGALQAMLPYMTPDTPCELLRATTWTYSCLCRKHENAEMVKLELVSPALPYISELLYSFEPEIYMIRDNPWNFACAALENLTEGPPEYIEAVQAEPELIVRLIAMVDRMCNFSVKKSALMTLCHMLDGTPLQRERCLKARCTESIVTLLNRDNNYLALIGTKIMVNILAGSPQEIQRALDLHVLDALAKVLANKDEQYKYEAVRSINSLIRCGTTEQVQQLQATGCLPPYCSQLDNYYAMEQVLDGLTNLMKVAAREDADKGKAEALYDQLKELGLVEKLRPLQEHEDKNVKEKSCHLLQTYFGEPEAGNSHSESDSE